MISKAKPDTEVHGFSFFGKARRIFRKRSAYDHGPPTDQQPTIGNATMPADTETIAEAERALRDTAGRIIVAGLALAVTCASALTVGAWLLVCAR
jgi:hypothetical protein